MTPTPMAAKRRALFLNEIGIGVQWVRHHASAPAQADVGTDADVAAGAQERMLDGMPDRPLAAPVVVVPLVPATLAPKPGSSPSAPIDAMDWPQLQDAVANCSACGLCRSRTRTVFGSGERDAKLLFVGAGPDRAEEAAGEPFTGASGKLLDNMLAAIAQQRSKNTYFTHLVKCRPVDAAGNDRAPTAQEVAACSPFLARQIALLQPDLIVAFGKTAALALRVNENVDSSVPPPLPLRGVVHRYAQDGRSGAGIALVATHPPATLLLQPADKAQAWADLCLVRSTYADLA
jgi:DNA polymerase